MHQIRSAESNSPSPAMFSECLYDITVTTDRIRIYAWLPLISNKNRFAICIYLWVCVRVNINGQTQAVIASHSVASPVISANTFDRELFHRQTDTTFRLHPISMSRQTMRTASPCKIQRQQAQVLFHTFSSFVPFPVILSFL